MAGGPVDGAPEAVARLARRYRLGVVTNRARAEALAFLDQSLDAGFRPGMGSVVPDRFFWALPSSEEADEDSGDGGLGGPPEPPQGPAGPATPRRVH